MLKLIYPASYASITSGNGVALNLLLKESKRACQNWFAAGSLSVRSLPMDDWTTQDWFAISSILGIICVIVLHVLEQP